MRDYKTGSVTDDDGSVRDDYALQVQLYAVLEKDTSGAWPDRGVLVPLPGAQAVVNVEPRSAQNSADRVGAALDSYNAAVTADEVATLGSPSPSTCRYCEYAPRCGSFWGAWSDDWEGAGLVAAAGTVVEIRKALRGGVSLDISVERGASESGRLSVHGLDDIETPVLGALARGDSVALVGLKLRGAGHAEPSRQLRLVAELGNRTMTA